MQENINLGSRSSFKIGGHCQYFFEVHNVDELEQALVWAEKSKIKPLILGDMTNVLLPDEELKMVIKMSPQAKIINKNSEITVWAGNKIAQFAWQMIQEGYQGMEEFTSLPGTVGGAVWNNAHFGNKFISEVLKEVKYYNCETKTYETKKMSELDFAYDQSWFQNNKVIIVEAVFNLKKTNDLNLVTQKALEIAQFRKISQPYEYPSAGCFWQNIPNSESLKKLFPQFEKQKLVSAGFLIDQAGLKGRMVGDAQVSDKHASFIVNRGKATASEVEKLAKIVKDEVKNKFGVKLLAEVVMVK